MCEGIFRGICSGLSHDTVLSRLLYDDFLRRRAPFKVFMKKATIKSIKYQLKNHCNPSVMQQFKITQQEVSNSLSGTCDIQFIFDLVVNYLFTTGSCQMPSSGLNAMTPQGCVQPKNEPQQCVHLKSEPRGCVQPKLDPQGCVQPKLDLQGCEQPKNEPQQCFHPKCEPPYGLVQTWLQGCVQSKVEPQQCTVHSKCVPEEFIQPKSEPLQGCVHPPDDDLRHDNELPRKPLYKKQQETSQLLQNVHRSLLDVQKERNVMLKRAQEEALTKGKLTNKVDWYDFSGCPRKYN